MNEIRLENACIWTEIECDYAEKVMENSQCMLLAGVDLT